MELWQLYILVTLPAIGGFLVKIGTIIFIIALLGGAVGAVVFAAAKAEQSETGQEIATAIFKTAKPALIVTILIIFVGKIIPTTNSMYMIVGGYAATNVEGVEKLPPNMVKAANKFLEQFTEGKK